MSLELTAVPAVSPHPQPLRLGAMAAEGGTAFAVLAPHAHHVDLCLFDDAGHEISVRLLGPHLGIWHGVVAGVEQGQRYGFRAHGQWAPRRGHRYNPAKLLLDPYGRGIEGSITPINAPGGPTLLSNRDASNSAPYTARSVVVAEPTWDFTHAKPRVPWRDTVVYETHVKGFSKLLPAVPEDLRGTYAGLAHPASLEYLTSLGVTTIELLPVQAFTSEQHLEHLGLSNYWGYAPLGYFAPHAAYATVAAQEAGAAAVRDEFRGMVDALHGAGLEVILDVVYNHTAEGSSTDRALSWRGLDNFMYYRHNPMNPGHDDDVTGTGNSLDFSQPGVIKMTLDSLRYWSQTMGVDGFRFDLAVTLGRTMNGFSTDHPFLVALTTDPELGSSKLIAEPWDIGLGGWQVGNFPPPLAEWNDRFRDYVRTFWLEHGAAKVGAREHATAPELATRLAGSSDLFGHTEPYGLRGPMASVNFITAHDGFTAYDLTSYNSKHNEANGESNRDGTDNNRSFNHGVEGETDDPSVMRSRLTSLRNLLGTLLLSAGTPMVLGGDEFGRTQRGNNNAYCQDTDISWFDWDLDPWQESLRQTVAHLISLRRSHEILRPTRFYDGIDDDPRDQLFRADSAWFKACGEPEDDDWWEDPSTRVVQFMRSLSDPRHADALLVINGSREAADVTIPADDGAPWMLAWDSAWDVPQASDADVILPGDQTRMDAMTMRLYLSHPAA